MIILIERMKENMKKLNKKGFTLVELLAVIVILAILMVVAFSVVPGLQNNAKETGMSTEAKKLESQLVKDYQMSLYDNTYTTYNFGGGTIETATASSPKTITLTDSNYKMIATFDGTKVTEYCIWDTKDVAAMKSGGSYTKGKTCASATKFTGEE